MATVKAIKYGMKGDDVSNLQTSLKNAGYNIDVDGNFGPQTLAAVKQYQQKNGLDVDGMVGPQTQAVLFGGPSNLPMPSVPSQDAAPSQPNIDKTEPTPTPAAAPASGVKKANNTQINYPDKFSYGDFSYGDYQESETVMQAQAALEAALAAQPGAYQSKWQDQINGIIDRILNREEFSYDVNSDALYQQYAEQYQRGGKLAMQDTMGQAAAMTGGFGNSYAATVGNQAYQAYLSQLNEMVPELYGMALDKYNREGEEMYNQYGLLSDQEKQDYGRYQDAYNQWLAERDYAAGRYDSERDYDYGKYVDDRNFDYGVYADDRNQAYNEYLSAVQQAQWGAQFDEGIREYEENMAFNKEQADISNSQWEQSFAETQKQNAIGNQQWETSRQDAIDSENRAYAREEALAIIAKGGEVDERTLKVAGLTKKAAQAMVAVESGNEEEALKGVKSMSYPEMEEALSTYAEAGKYDLAESMIDHLYDAYMISDEEYKKMLARYTKSNGHTITDTTVATPTIPIKGNGGGGQAMIKY